MNKAYAFFCRAYQTVFRAALPILPYREPVQLDGLASIVPLLTEKEISSVLLVTDASVRALGLTGGLEDALKAASVACAVYDKTVPNPTIANIEEGRALYLSAHAQAIIAVGGGSVMDCAKIIGARIAKPRQPVQRMGGLLRISDARRCSSPRRPPPERAAKRPSPPSSPIPPRITNTRSTISRSSRITLCSTRS
ncbi:MAG: iron-containing alcohol dehydrogenase [Christensenellales bacterium]